ncbi:protein ROLLING AND ERECT LEAF 2-like [Euphorbia lathyris]|uniref:protein ROLLING AND ERECT LEAF 2-like n=1 Tax=Euphorbia lathyris TaxID=212925 RepID=UPI0033135F0D
MSEMEPQPEANEPMLVVEENMELPVPMPAVVKKGGGIVGRRARKPLTLLQVFADLNDHFFKAFESSHEVSKMLEAIKLQFNQKPIDHSKRVMHVISWNRSFQGIPSVVDDFDAEENEANATVSDEMVAWEKKLYDEVKVCYCCILFYIIPIELEEDFFLSI